MSAARNLHGVIVPLTTPFDAAGAIDEGGFVAQTEWMLSQGVHGVVVGGSTGEGFALEEGELVRLVELAIATIGDRAPVLASIIADSTRAAVRRAELLRRFPLSALQVAPPHYIFTPSPAGLVEFYRAVGAASPAPIIIYNVVPWAQVDAALAGKIVGAADRVIAVKQSDRDFGAYAALVRSIGSERVFAAIDGGLMSCYELGAAGSIAALASAAPRASVALWDAVKAGRRDAARALHDRLLDLWAALSAPNLPARVKAAQAVQGLAITYPRSPMAAAGEAETAAIARALAGLRPLLPA